MMKRPLTISDVIVGKKMPHDKIHLFRDILIIDYEWWTDGCNQGFWRGEMYDKDDNEIYADHHTKEKLIERAKKEKWNWMVVRHHKRGGGFTVIKIK